MAASSLPFELQQHTFSFLDIQSFYAARKTCRSWYYASTDTVTLFEQLRKLPILPLVSTAALNNVESQRLYQQAAHTLLLDLDIRRKQDRQCGPHSAISASKLCTTATADRAVNVDGRSITPYDSSNQLAKPIRHKPLNDFKEKVGNGPWLKTGRFSHPELALSSDGNLLAVAQERTVQVYSLADGPDSYTVNGDIPSAAGHYICGLEFEHNDHVLRVRFSAKGTVLYLGAPPLDDREANKADFKHWQSEAGLGHVFLDSSRLNLPSSDDGCTPRVTGLQLLKPFRNGFLFAAQKHGDRESSRYILGHFKPSVPSHAQALTAEYGSATVLADLHSFMSGWKYSLYSRPGNGLGLSENMPTAHEHHPRFAMSQDCSLLALAEKVQNYVRPTPISRVFLYRLPATKAMEKLLEHDQRRSSMAWEDMIISNTNVEIEQSPIEDMATTNVETGAFHVGRVPKCLTTLTGELTDLRFERYISTEPFVLKASTADCTRTWDMAPM